MASPKIEVEVPAGPGQPEARTLLVSNPDKVFFPERGETKLDLINYYLAVGEGALRGVRSRPTVMKRYPDGATGDFFFQKRVPANKPDWLNTVTVAFPSGRTAEELCPTDVAHIIWAVNLGCLDLNPWAVRKWDVEHPDELRIDLDPSPGIGFEGVREVALAMGQLFDEMGIVGYPKTSGSRGIHIVVRILPKWDFLAVRRAALAAGREIERRLPDIATSKWWKEERGARVFIDYNQNARDRTVASAYSVRARADALTSAPITWDEVATCQLTDFDIHTLPERFARLGDLHAAIDDTPCSLQPLLDLAARDEAEGLGDAPWPPNFAKQAGEPRRVQPSRRRPGPD